MAYLWLKAWHIIAMVTWFAGLFYMFRIFVYHAENQEDASRVALLKVMARKLYKYITTPAMVLTFVLGFALLATAPHVASAGWFHAKLVLLFALAGYHGFIGKTLRRFAKDDVYLTSKQCRWLNEAPTIALLGIVFLAVLKPF